MSQHVHNSVDVVFLLIRHMCRGFGGWRDEGWRPETVSMLIPPLLCLLSQLHFLFLI